MKEKAKTICFWVLGCIYFPIYLVLMLLRWIFRFCLALTHYGTFNYVQGNRIMKSLFNPDYERAI